MQGGPLANMAELTTGLENESWVVFLDADQGETRALLRRFDRHSVIFEHYTLDAVLRVSEVLSNFKIVCRGSVIYSGRVLVRSLVNRVLPPGRYSEVWDGRDGSGQASPSGVYFYRFETADHSASRKMILVR